MTLPRIPQGAVYVAVGLATTGVHVGLAMAARLAGLAPLAANFTGYVAAVVFSYFGHAWLTFRRDARSGAQFARFVVVSLVGLALNQLIVHVGSNLLRLPFWASLTGVVVLVPPVTFLLAKAWAFAERKPR